MRDNGDRYFIGVSNYEPQTLIFPVNDGAVLRMRVMGAELGVRRVVGEFNAQGHPIYVINGFKYVMDVIRAAPGDDRPMRTINPPEQSEESKKQKPKKLKRKYRKFRKILAEEINDFAPWTIRVAHCFLVERIATVRDLVSRTEADLLRVPNFGYKSVKEVKAVLKRKGLQLGMDV
jgi:hypothetical protein